MFKLSTDKNELYDDLMSEIMLFDDPSDYFIVEHFCETTDVYVNKVAIKTDKGIKEYRFSEPVLRSNSQIRNTRYFKRAAKKAVYCAMKQFTGKQIPWGSLTGIRPTYLAYEFLNEGGSIDDIPTYLMNTFDVSPKRAVLARDIISAQRNYISDCKNSVVLYIHIPFCPSRCSYCSFTSLDYAKAEKLVDPYIDLLTEEISEAMDIIKENGYMINSVYIGGGTPTSLDGVRLERLLKAIPVGNVEFTVEAGRPDTITREKLEICKRYGVTRISVNPQSLDENVLAAIGRRHGEREFFDAFGLAREYGFTINTDLIMGLPMQTKAIAKRDIETVAALHPENITVHTLSIKNGSAMKLSTELPRNVDTEAMMDYAIDYLTQKEYSPYYLYRQKNMLGNLENIGFTLEDCQCLNNIATMEELSSVIACGAGAISKRVFAQGRIERFANLRDVRLYIERGKERFSKKRIFYSNQFTF